MFIPFISITVCSDITIITICKQNRLSMHNNCSRAMFKRRRQSSIIICAFIIILLLLLTPSEISRFYLFLNHRAKIHKVFWHDLLNYISYLYITLNPCIAFLFSFEIRQKLKYFFSYVYYAANIVIYYLLYLWGLMLSQQ